MEVQGLTTPMKRPGGRTERVRKAVAAAVLGLLEQGAVDFEMQDVIAASGVGRSTLFRRWPNRSALLREALQEHTSQLAFVTSRDWTKDLAENLKILRDFMLQPVEMAFNRIFLTSDDQSIRELIYDSWKPVLEAFEHPLRRAQRDGEMDQAVTPSRVVEVIFSDLVLRSLAAPFAPMTDAYLADLQHMLMKGALHRPHSAS